MRQWGRRAGCARNEISPSARVSVCLFVPSFVYSFIDYSFRERDGSNFDIMGIFFLLVGGGGGGRGGLLNDSYIEICILSFFLLSFVLYSEDKTS